MIMDIHVKNVISMPKTGRDYGCVCTHYARTPILVNGKKQDQVVATNGRGVLKLQLVLQP
jgi:hypothetical protein